MFVPGARYAEIPGGPVMPGRRRAGMEEPAARSRSPAASPTSAIAAMTGSFAPTSPSRSPIYSATPASRCRRAPTDGATETRTPHEIRSETSRSPQASCHVMANFAESRLISMPCKTQVFKSGLSKLGVWAARFSPKLSLVPILKLAQSGAAVYSDAPPARPRPLSPRCPS